MSRRVQGLVAQAKLRLERSRARWGAVDVAVRSFKRYSEDDGGSYAAALTYYTFLSIFPLLIFGLAILGYITFGDEELQERIFDAGLRAAPMFEDALTKKGLAAIEEARRTLALTGVALALYSGSGAVVALEHALNKVQRVAQEPNFLGKRLRSVMWLAVLGVAALASTALSALGRYADNLFESIAPLVATAAALLFYLGAVAIAVGIFATAFKFLPAARPAWREVLPGAIVAAVGFELLKTAGATYLDRGAQSRNATFGAFATAAGLLVTSYLISQVTLMAAEVNAVLAERRNTRQSSRNEPRGGHP